MDEEIPRHLNSLATVKGRKAMQKTSKALILILAQKRAD